MPGPGDTGMWRGLENFLLWRVERPKHLEQFNAKMKKKKKKSDGFISGSWGRGRVKWRDEKCKFSAVPHLQLMGKSSGSPITNGAPPGGPPVAGISAETPGEA